MRATDLRDRGILYEYPPKTKERKDRRLANEWTVCGSLRSACTLVELDRNPSIPMLTVLKINLYYELFVNTTAIE